MLYCVFMGVVQNYPRLPFRHAFANLSSPFALNQNRGREVLAYGPYSCVYVSYQGLTRELLRKNHLYNEEFLFNGCHNGVLNASGTAKHEILSHT